MWKTRSFYQGNIFVMESCKILLLQVYVDTLVKKAYDNWNQVIEYDGKSLLSVKQSKRSSASRNELPMGPVDYALDNQLTQPRLPGSVSSEQSLMDSSVLIGGKHGLFLYNLIFVFPIFFCANCWTRVKLSYLDLGTGFCHWYWSKYRVHLSVFFFFFGATAT